LRCRRGSIWSCRKDDATRSRPPLRRSTPRSTLRRGTWRYIGNKQVAASECTVADGRLHITEAEAAARDALARRHEVPGVIQKARSTVAAIRVAAQSVAAAGHATEAFYLLGEVKQALVRLNDTASMQSETELSSRLADGWVETKYQKTCACKSNGTAGGTGRAEEQQNPTKRSSLVVLRQHWCRN
jgi:hypothetical protein